MSETTTVERGNDPTARQEIITQYGPHQNAEDLIAAHRNSYDPALLAASLKGVDEDATAALDLSEIKPKWGGTVISAAVRGGTTVYVAELPDGSTYKAIVAKD